MTTETPGMGHRVLIVEDEPTLAELYAAWLEDHYEVVTTHHGDAALAAYDETVDVVLLDRRLPGVSGDRILDHIRNDEGECRVAMVSAVTPDFDIYELGFDDYLVKPVSGEELRALVEHLLRLNAYEEGIRRQFALTSKLALLRTHRSEAELRDSEEYAALRAELDELDRELAETVGEFSVTNIGAVLRDA